MKKHVGQINQARVREDPNYAKAAATVGKEFSRKSNDDAGYPIKNAQKIISSEEDNEFASVCVSITVTPAELAEFKNNLPNSTKYTSVENEKKSYRVDGIDGIG